MCDGHDRSCRTSVPEWMHHQLLIVLEADSLIDRNGAATRVDGDTNAANSTAVVDQCLHNHRADASVPVSRQDVDGLDVAMPPHQSTRVGHPTAECEEAHGNGFVRVLCNKGNEVAAAFPPISESTGEIVDLAVQRELTLGPPPPTEPRESLCV